MRAIVCRTYGDPETLSFEEIPALAPQPGQVVVAVHASGVNFGDTLIVGGMGQTAPPKAFTPGYEVAGTVARVGAGVTGLALGTRVIAFPFTGGYAEEAAAGRDFVYPILDSIDFATGAAILATYGTAHHALVYRAGLKTGETVLVLGAAGGAGLAAVEIARLMGARVIAAASNDGKLALCAKFGAHDGINYSTDDFRARLQALAPKGADVVYDPVGGALFQDALACTANLGRYLIVGFAAGEVPQIPAFMLLTKQIAAMGIYWGGFMQQNPTEARRTVEELIGHVAAGRLKPHVSKTFPLAEAPLAMRHLLRREAAGKVVLFPR